MQQSIDLNTIQTFIAVVESGSFSLAAQKLLLQKSTISRQIKSLEDHIGNQLFYRTTRSVEVTPAGETLYSECKQSYDAILNAVVRQSKKSMEFEGVLRVSTVEDIGIHLLTPAIAKFIKSYPKVRVDLVLTLENLNFVKDNIDVIVRVGSLNLQSARQRKVGKVRFVFAATPKFLNLSPEVKNIEDVVSLPLVAFSSFQASKKGLKVFRKSTQKTLKIEPRMQVDNAHAVIEMTKNHLGIGLIPDYLCRPSFAAGELVPVCGEWGTEPKDIRVATVARKKVSPIIDLFTGFVSEEIVDKLQK